MPKLESNQMRRAHRVNIPLTVVINNHTYITKDWSMTGVGLVGFDMELQKDEIINAAIIIVMQEARLEMQVQLQFKSKRGDVSGFEFAKISQKNKHVLREFLELSIEGKLDQIDGLVNVYHEPIVDTPIKESVVLSDEEETLLKKEFTKRARVYITLAIIFFILLLATIYYNTAYIYKSIGTVTGNFARISANNSGKISDLYVKSGERVTKGTLLFELDNSDLLNKLAILELKIKKLQKLSHKDKNTTHDHSILYLLQKNYLKQKQAYYSAQDLYKKHYITKYELVRTYNLFIAAKLKYLQEKTKNIPSNIVLKDKISILTTLTDLEIRQKEIIQKLQDLRIFSPKDGKIYAIKINKGMYVTASDISIIIELDTQPYIVCKVKQDEALNIHKGMDVKIYDYNTDTTYDAYVSTVGNLALNTDSHITNEVSLKEVTIKILFKDKKLRLPLNERVKVWFHRPLL